MPDSIFGVPSKLATVPAVDQDSDKVRHNSGPLGVKSNSKDPMLAHLLQIVAYSGATVVNVAASLRILQFVQHCMRDVPLEEPVILKAWNLRCLTTHSPDLQRQLDGALATPLAAQPAKRLESDHPGARRTEF